MDPQGPERAEALLAEAAWVHRLARALLRDSDLAADVAQDALVVALERRPAVGNELHRLRGWLASITRRLAFRAVRERSDRVQRERCGARPDGDDSERRAAERLQLHRQLTDAVLALPEPYRTAVTLRFFEGLTPRAIARQRRQRVEAVRQHVHRGLVMLRQRLDGEFGERGAWIAAFGAFDAAGTMGTTLTWMPFLAMNKFAAAAAVVVLAAGTWMLLKTSEPVVQQTALAGTGSSVHADQLAATPSPAVELRDVAVAPAPMQRQQVPFVVWVVDDGDRPMADATVRCWQEGREPTLRNTGADGRAGFAAVDRAGGLLVQASACMQVLQSLPHLVGEHRVVLGAGKRVAGQMLVDGKPAPAGLRLRLSGKPLASKAVLPPSIVELLQIWRPQSTTATDDSGHFAFHGLPSDWTGSLDLPLTHWLLPGPERDSCRLPAPCEDLIVATTHLQSVEGRVVWADTGEGVVEPEITVFGEFTDGDSSPGTSLTGDAHGCFGVGFGPGSSGKHDRWFDPARRTPIAHVQLTASARGSAGKTTVELDAEQLRAGDIVVRLQRAPTTHFLAVGKGGQPIAGARVLSNRASEPTGPDGRGVFIGPPDHLLVGAPGCQIMPAEPARPAAGTIDDPLVFVLVPGNRLVLRVRNTMGEVPILWEIVLRSRRNLFAGPANNAQTELHHLLGSSHMNGHWSDKQASAFAVLDDRGEVVLESLVPDQPFTVAVVDRLFTELLTQELVTPALGQSRELDLVIAARPRTLHGCVRARDGAPLRDPRIEGKVGDHSNRIEVAVDGTFALTQIYVQEPLTLVVRCPGFVSQVREGLTPEHDDQEVVFALEPAHKVTVQVLDEQDAAVPVGRVRVQGAGPVPIDEQELAPGEFTFADLPLGNVTFRCELGSHPFEVVHDTANERAVLRVPRPARVLVLPPEGVANSAASSFDAAVTRLDAAEEPMELALSTGNGAPPHLLLPGRYRFALVRWERRGGGIEHFEVGAAAEVELPAGVVTRVQLR